MDPTPPSSVDAAQAALALSFEAVAIADARDGRILDVNPTWGAVYGHDPDQIRSLHLADLLDGSVDGPMNRPVDGPVDRTASLDGPLRWHLRRDGSRFPVEVRTCRARSHDREVVVVVTRDLSPRPLATGHEHALDTPFRDLMDALPDCVLIHRSGITVYANKTLIHVLGYESSEGIVGTSVMDLIHPDERGGIRERVRATAAGHTVPRREERLLRKDGSIVTLEVAAMPILFEGEPSVLVLGRDVTERKRLEAQLVTIDRLASLGRLAAAVGHEINNPIAYVLGSLELLRRELDAAGKNLLTVERMQALQERIGIAREGAERVRDIVRDLRTLSRDDAELHRPMDLQRVLELCIDMAGHELQQRAKVVRNFSEIPRVMANEARLGQVFLNLLSNAAQSIPEGNIGAHEIRVSTSVVDEMVTIDIRDTGVGIASEARDRIFEPFFTTKPIGIGIGLGLSICHHVVTALGGVIRVIEHAPGTTFRVMLPPADGFNSA